MRQMRDQLKKTKRIIIRPPSRGAGPLRRGGSPRSPWTQGVLALVIFLILVSTFSLFSGLSEKVEVISLSELASGIKAGEISTITVKGDDLEVKYKNGDEKIGKKEAGTALTTTLKNYDVPAPVLANVKIDVENNQGELYWIASLAPILLPFLFILFFLWFLSRQVKGAGMQSSRKRLD